MFRMEWQTGPQTLIKRLVLEPFDLILLGLCVRIFRVSTGLCVSMLLQYLLYTVELTMIQGGRLIMVEHNMPAQTLF